MNNREIAKQWQRDWMEIRREFLAGRLPTPVVAQVSSSVSDGYRWECPECGAFGSPLKSASRAETMGEGHVQVHASEDDLAELEKLKVLNIPEQLLTGYQRACLEELLAESRE